MPLVPAPRRPLAVLGALALAGLPACSRDGDAPTRPPNVLLISIDTLRADHVGAYGYGRDTSPNLDALAADGVRFEEAVAESSWTLPTHATMFTGLGQSVHGVGYGRSRLDGSVTTLAETLSAAGYRTKGVWTGPFLHSFFGLDQGFDEYLGFVGETCYDQEAFDVDDESSREEIKETHDASHRTITSADVTDEALRYFGEVGEVGDAPFFLFLHYFDVHADYIPAEEFVAPFLADLPEATNEVEAKRNDLLARYDGEIRWTDHHVGRLLDGLAERGLADDTIVVVTSDHGEEFLEHGRYGHNATLYDEVLLVPLIVRPPDLADARRGAVVEATARHADLMPTILELADLEAPGPFTGSSLAAAIRGERTEPRAAVSRLRLGETYAWTAVRFHGKKLVRKELADGDDVAVFDLETDPAERTPLAGDDAVTLLERFSEQLEAIDAFEAGVRARLGLGEGGDVDLPPHLRRALEELGYLEG